MILRGLRESASSFSTAVRFIDKSSDSQEANFNSQMDKIKDEKASDDIHSEKYCFTLAGGTLHGILDPDNVQLRVEKITGLRSNEHGAALLKKVIHNLEVNHPKIDIVLWDIPKSNAPMLMLVLDNRFEVYEVHPEYLTVAYHLASIVPGWFDSLYQSAGGGDSDG